MMVYFKLATLLFLDVMSVHSDDTDVLLLIPPTLYSVIDQAVAPECLNTPGSLRDSVCTLGKYFLLERYTQLCMMQIVDQY